ncbi:helix-turn-helix domain-containing protein [Streptomyces sp. NBC_01198]|uniref:helix-turn-helix domain-containing protein n=1 Tax=Streptomyces sp. NBC_01198 TaxID=2903769 RepID=UPI002E0E5764|nr:helix-turn-helix domain-containing protein [Streptomyces sp. NBC_01198]
MGTEAGEFAAQLHRLKERSGRSYGVLASRLHISTSTLHRYCNGAAVPRDYAPVERFARLCGASPEELLTLHRSWLLADAARSEPDRAAAARAAAPEPELAPGPDPTPPAGPPPAPEAAEPVPAPAPVPLPASAPRGWWTRRRTAGVLAAVTVLAAIAAFSLRSGFTGDTSDAVLPAPVASSVELAPSGSVPPLHVSVTPDNWSSPCDQWFLLSQQPDRVPPPPVSPQERTGWATALGGIPAHGLQLALSTAGSPGEPVILHALYVTVLSDRPAPKGIGYTTGAGCAGRLVPLSFHVDLDSAPARATPVSVPGYDRTRVVSGFPFQISATDSQILDVAAFTADRDVSWYLELAWSRGHQQGVLRVDDHGRPFRTVGLDGDPAYSFNGHTWKPTPAPK